MKTIAFVGNPNTGKTALINAIAGSDLQVGNWPGVTVEKKEVIYSYNYEDLHLIDLPGTYTLSPYSLEERITRDVICSEQIDGIINVVDTTQLRRNLYLTLELIDLQKPLVLALNFFDEFSKRGYEIDIEKLQNLLGTPIVATIASKGIGKNRLIQEIYSAIKTHQIPKTIPYQEHIEKEIAFLQHKMANEPCRFKRFLAIKLLENDSFAIDRAKKMDPSILEAAKKAQERLQRHFKMSVKEFIIQDRYQKIDSILDKVLQKPLVDKTLLSDKIDAIVLHKWLGIPLFFVIMFLMFKITFDGSAPFVAWMGGFFEDFIAPHLRSALQDAPAWIVSLVVDGVVSGVGLVLSFLPLLAFLYFFMALLEESGYMSRVSFLLDRIAATIGIKGNAFIALIVGFGCNVPAIYATRTMSSLRERIIATLMIPFMSCSARLPVYALFTSLFFATHQALIISLLYILGIVVAFVVAFIANKLLPQKEHKPFFIELPPYHIPTWRTIWISMWPRLKDFILRAGTLIVIASTIVWALIVLPPSSTPQTSYLSQFAQKISPIFKPIGFGEHWEPVAVLIPGTLAKEVIIGSLGTIYGIESKEEKLSQNELSKDLSIQIKKLLDALNQAIHNIFHLGFQSLENEKASSKLQQKIKEQFGSPWAALSYMVFVLLYIPCVSTLAAIKSEFGWRLMWFEVIFLPLIAYSVSWILYQILP